MSSEQWLPDFDEPDDLTPEERLAHIIRILAFGAIRLTEAENDGRPQPDHATAQVDGLDQKY